MNKRAGCVVRKVFRTQPCLLSLPRSRGRDRSLGLVQVCSWLPTHRAALGRLQYLSCDCPQQKRGHETRRKMPVNCEIASRILKFFDESGSRIRKPCKGGRFPLTAYDTCKITRRNTP